MNFRENARLISQNKKSELVEAILILKNVGNPRTGRKYDTYVQWHKDSVFEAPNEFGFRSYSHWCPGFLPWHRKFLQLFEEDLQGISGNSNLAIPYWDWTTDGAESDIWKDDFFGGNGVETKDWVVGDGPFAFDNGKWNLNVRNPDVEPDGALRRAFGVGGITLPELPAVRDAYAKSRSTYDVAPWTSEADMEESFRNYLERPLHGPPHPWVGGRQGSVTIGSMGNVYTSPNDPIFFLHHSNVDRIWAKWQDLYAGSSYLPLTPIEGVIGSGKDEKMEPFAVTVRSVLDYRALGYVYDGRASDDPKADEIAERKERLKELAFDFV